MPKRRVIKNKLPQARRPAPDEGGARPRSVAFKQDREGIAVQGKGEQSKGRIRSPKKELQSKGRDSWAKENKQRVKESEFAEEEPRHTSKFLILLMKLQ